MPDRPATSPWWAAPPMVLRLAVLLNLGSTAMLAFSAANAAWGFVVWWSVMTLVGLGFVMLLSGIAVANAYDRQNKPVTAVDDGLVRDEK